MKNKKDSKKVKVVFEEPKVNLHKTTSHKSKSPDKNNLHSKEHTSQAHHANTPHTHHTTHKKKNISKDYIIIGILTALIIGIVIVSFLVPLNKNDKPIDENGLGGDFNSDINQSKPVGQTLSEEEIEIFENKVLELNLKILKDMREYQKEVLLSYSEELKLDSDDLQFCLSENNYLLDDANMFSFKKISLIQEDFFQAQELLVTSTPTLYVNGYYLSGFKEYKQFNDFLNSVTNTENLSLDYSKKDFTVLDDSLKLYVIYDKDNPLIDNANKEFINYLQNSPDLIDSVKEVFTSLFSISNIEYVQYNSELGKNILQTIDASSLPAYYLVGDESALGLNQENKDIFNIIFKEENVNNGFVINPDILSQFFIGSGVDGVYKILDFKKYISLETDVLINLEGSNPELAIMLFTDYDCPFCKQFEEETLNETFFVEFIDSGKAQLIIKPMVTNDVFSIFPILFLKCSNDQNKALEVHKKIFSLSSEIGVLSAYNLVSERYQDQLSELEKEYERLMNLMNN